jgi:phage terminase small subunit
MPGLVPGIHVLASREARAIAAPGKAKAWMAGTSPAMTMKQSARRYICSNPRDHPMLTPRQQRFVEEYLIDPNGHQAALRAGYSPRGARQTVTHLLKHPEIAQAIRRGMEARAERMRLDADRVLAELARIAFADIGNFVDWGPEGVTLKPKQALTPEDRAAVAEIASGAGRYGAGPRLRLHSKPRALDAIARHFGLYGKTAKRFEPVRPHDGKPAREILREKLAAMAAEKETETEENKAK